MDVHNEKFYDEISSFMPQHGDYSLEDLDEIIRSTDINTITNSFDQNDFDMAIADINGCNVEPDHNNQKISPPEQKSQLLSTESETQNYFGHDYNLNFSAFSSPATSQQSAGYSSSYETLGRTSSPILMIGNDYFNPEEFIDFINDDGIKVNDLSSDKMLTLKSDYRNTPSPTDSWSSSIASSTSGIQSDDSSVVSISQTDKPLMKQESDELLEFIKFKNDKLAPDFDIIQTSQKSQQLFDDIPKVVTEEDSRFPAAATESTFMPIAVPVLPMPTVTNLQPISYVQGTIIPVQTLPLATIESVTNIKAPAATKVNTSSTTNTVVSQPSTIEATPNNEKKNVTAKIIPPQTMKPKTIFLSSNDFKSLMQKMSTNGKKIAGINGQTPKIIMKTANGKVIAANKITNKSINNQSPASSATSFINNSLVAAPSNCKSLQYTSKLTKESSSVIIKDHASKIVSSNPRSAATVPAARVTVSHPKNSRISSSMPKYVNDDKLLKKQLRMLKNRESASLSRKKKKEYIERLENRISDLEKENHSLQGENSSLRSQLIAFAKTCKCKHGNVSEFILNTLSMDNKNCGRVLNEFDASYLAKNEKHLDNYSSENKSNLSSITTNHVKIAPKPIDADPFINKGFKHRMNASTVKKNVAFLFAMAFMVTWNVGYFQNYLNKSTLENAIEASVSGAKEESIPNSGRHLLWVPNEDEFHEQLNRSKRESEIKNIPPPPLHFLRPANRTTGDKMNGTSAKDEPPIKTSSDESALKTGIYANSTLENMRLTRNLHKWIGGNDYLNLTGTGIKKNIEQVDHYKFGSGSYMDYDLPLQVGIKQKRKIISEAHTKKKQAKFDIRSDHNSLDIFNEGISEEYLRLFRGIKKQDDMFYVLSFNMEDHLLLPASANDKNSRPKISVMLPAGNPLSNGDIVLMQIDCEVKNTTELKIKSDMIPEKLKPSKFPGNEKVNRNVVSNNETVTSDSVTKIKYSSTNNEETKEKPSPRTYFMMGSKSHTTSESVNSIVSGGNAVKRKPTIVKLNANDSVIGSGILNVRNSSLFSRMRETVVSQASNLISPTDVKKFM